ncbi:hypothetical protein CLIB1423_03S00386 [[Candida] railenensis]|uniref:Uncharacterized protein n=1 Tax=[Candida] railenensis TaxID=45579 RepID=A0A9P0QM11_9ASCO|nr:hypothetical protein CLIB1423_03S00386 [[Candida] railenensis]
MFRLGRRGLATSLVCSNYAKTTLNPESYKLLVQQSDVRAGILFVTPSLLPTIIGKCSEFHKGNPGIQLIVAGVDSLLDSRRNGVSELWLNNSIDVREAKLLQSGSKKTEPRESDGINIVSAKENWKLSESQLQISVDEDIEISISLANTLFSTGYMSTLFVLDEGKEYSGEALQNLSIGVKTVKESGSSSRLVETKDNWTPLYEYSATSDPLIITKSIGNLVKEINGKSASSYLQDNEKLMSIGSKDTQVYVKLFQKSNSSFAERFEVIAGGGGWGAKASTIVISPTATFAEGDRLEFYMLTPTDRFNKGNIIKEREKKDEKVEQEVEEHKNLSNGSIVAKLECSYEQTTYDSDEDIKAMEIFEGVLSAGSESGYKLNGVQHVSAGEQTRIVL